MEIIFYFLIGIKREQEIRNPCGVKNARQRIVDEQMNVITKHFCAIMNKYYQSVMIHRERCIQRIQRQNQLSMEKKKFFLKKMFFYFSEYY